MRTRAFRKVLVGSMIIVGLVTMSGTTLAACGRKNSSAGSSTGSSASSSAGTASPTAARQQVTLPIKGGEYFYPNDVAVDAQGNLYVTAVNDGVLKLAPGAQSAVSVGFTGLEYAVSGGADAAGNVYVTDNGGKATAGKGRVQKRTPAGAQTELPFGGLG